MGNISIKVQRGKTSIIIRAEEIACGPTTDGGKSLMIFWSFGLPQTYI